jgi:hypothetical protein
VDEFLNPGLLHFEIIPTNADTHTTLIQKEKHENLNYNLLFSSSSSSSYLLALSVRIFLKTLANLVKYTLDTNSKKFPICF